MSEKQIQKIRKASICIIENLENTIDSKDFLILDLEKINKQYILLDRIYELNKDTYYKCIPPQLDYKEVQSNLEDSDNLSLIMNLDEATKKYALLTMKCSLERAEHTLSFLLTLKNMVNSYIIVDQVYNNPVDEKTLSELKDVKNKFLNKKNIYTFWKELDNFQKQKFLDWYNKQKPENVLAHPLYKLD